ncbi:hypothetical protein V6N13_009260 [Hibiscus sabdariffa]|uniref:Uncharacterized protein n=2 Tax=Hibiscus sabdariffa TaxID=183260 RepID=A0ABR2DHP7_9ROSI
MAPKKKVVVKDACRPLTLPPRAPSTLSLIVSKFALVRFLTDEDERRYNEEFSDRDFCWEQGFDLSSMDDPHTFAYVHDTIAKLK